MRAQAQMMFWRRGGRRTGLQAPSVWLIDWYPIRRPRRPRRPRRTPIARKIMLTSLSISFTHGIEFGAKCPRRWNMFPQEKISRTLSKNVTKAHPFSKFEKRGFPPKIPHLTTSLNLARRLQIGMSNSFSPGRPALMAPSPGAMQVTGGAGITENLDRPNMPVTLINLASSRIHILKIWPPQVHQPVRERLVERSSRPSKRGGDREERTSYHK